MSVDLSLIDAMEKMAGEECGVRFLLFAKIWETESEREKPLFLDP